jgi:hypothetical protein
MLNPVPKSLPHPRETAAMVRLADELTTALRSMIDSSPFAGLGPIEITRTLGVDKTFSSRLMSALRAEDPLVALSLLPGVVPLRQFVDAARKQGARARAVQSAEHKLRAFDHELQRAFGTRTRLDAVIADTLPEARRRHEESARQAVYRGMAMIKGISLDLNSITWVVHPSANNPRRVDILVLAAFVGIHRLRPTARFRVGANHARMRSSEDAKLLRQFCRPPDLSISVSSDKDYTFYEVSTGSVRRDAGADVFLSELLTDAAPRKDPRKANGVWHVGEVSLYPMRRLELVLLVHRNVWPGCDFSLRAYDTAGRDVVVLPAPDREFDRLSIDATIARSPADAEALRASPVPRYSDVLRHLTTPLGWKLEESPGGSVFNKISCEIAYPLYGSQIMLVWE